MTRTAGPVRGSRARRVFWTRRFVGRCVFKNLKKKDHLKDHFQAICCEGSPDLCIGWSSLLFYFKWNFFLGGFVCCRGRTETQIGGRSVDGGVGERGGRRPQVRVAGGGRRPRRPQLFDAAGQMVADGRQNVVRRRRRSFFPVPKKNGKTQ